MAKLVTQPTRFTHPEWQTSNLTKYANAESERSAAERLVEESKRLADETEKRTEKTQRDVNKKFRKHLFLHSDFPSFSQWTSLLIWTCPFSVYGWYKLFFILLKF